MRATDGNRDGVTNASISPLTPSTPTNPSATSMPERAVSASARPRVRPGPGAIHAQPIRRPTPAETNTAVSSNDQIWGTAQTPRTTFGVEDTLVGAGGGLVPYTPRTFQFGARIEF